MRPATLPMNSMTKADGDFRLVLLLGALVAFGPLAIDLYLPALPAIARGLLTTPDKIELTITVFLAGFSLGMLFYGPISDSRGRRPVMLAGIVLFSLASLACVLARAVDWLITARFFQALGGGAASVLARAVVRDRYPPVEAIRQLSLMAMVTTVAPLLAPLLGSLLLAWFGWRGTFASLLLWGLLSLLVVWRMLPESHPVHLRSNAGVGAAFSAYWRLITDPAALGLALAGGMSFAAMFAYITGSPYYLIELKGFSPGQYGLVFALNAAGIFGANYLNSRVVRKHSPLILIGLGSSLAFAGGVCLLLAIKSDVMPAMLAAQFLVVAMTGLLGANCVGLLMSRYPSNSGAAAAFFGSSQFGLGMLASAAVSHHHDGSGMPMAWVMLTVCSLSAAGHFLYRHFRH